MVFGDDRLMVIHYAFSKKLTRHYGMFKIVAVIYVANVLHLSQMLIAHLPAYSLCRLTIIHEDFNVVYSCKTNIYMFSLILYMWYRQGM